MHRPSLPPDPPRSSLAAPGTLVVKDTLTSLVSAQQVGGLATALAGATSSVYGANGAGVTMQLSNTEAQDLVHVLAFAVSRGWALGG